MAEDNSCDFYCSMTCSDIDPPLRLVGDLCGHHISHPPTYQDAVPSSVAASTPVIAAASSSVATSVGGGASTSRRSKQRKRSGGFGVNLNPNTGAQILNPGGRGQQGSFSWDENKCLCPRRHIS